MTICCWNEYNSESLSFRIIPSTYPTAFLVTPVSSTLSFLVTALVTGIFFFFLTWGEKVSLVRPSFVKNSFRFRWYLVVINLRHYSGPSCKLQTPCSILWACLQCAVFIIKLPSKFISEQGISCGRKKNTSRMLHWKYTCTSPQHSPWDKKNCLLQWGGYFRGTRMLILLFFFFSKNSFGQKNCLLQHTNKCGLIIFLIKNFSNHSLFWFFLQSLSVWPERK